MKRGREDRGVRDVGLRCDGEWKEGIEGGEGIEMVGEVIEEIGVGEDMGKDGVGMGRRGSG